MTKRFWALSLSLLLLGAAAPALACSCIGTPTIEEQLNQRELIFVGVVTSVETDPVNASYSLVHFNATHYWVGSRERLVHVSTPNNEAACGYTFLVGQKYLVFADENDLGEDTTGLFTHLCLDNTPFDYAGDKLDELGEGLTPIETQTWSRIKALFGEE